MQALVATDFLDLPSRGFAMLDVRTPAEYEQGHIPGALNLPLFSNEERAEVGTLYKQVSPEKAYFRGLEIAGAKMAGYLREAFRLVPGRKVAVHCWRGGKRSSSIGTLLEFSGFQVSMLHGGYKSYRNHLLDSFRNPLPRLLVLGGKTGSGKTEILQHLRALGEQVIDLEGLAHHKGSAFGALGQAPQPTVEQFENNLFYALSGLDASRRIWIENESRSIGRVFIPQGFWDQAREAPLIRLEVPFEQRLEYIIAGYGQFGEQELEVCLLKIEKRMGGLQVKEALKSFRAGDIAGATSIALEYYDKTYTHATSKGCFSSIVQVDAKRLEPRLLAQKIISAADAHQF